MFRWSLRTGMKIAKGDISIDEPLGGSLFFAFSRMLCQHVAKVCRERCQNGKLEPSFWARVVNMLRKREKRSMVFREDAETLQGHHHIARPAVQGMHHHKLNTSGCNIFEQFPK